MSDEITDVNEINVYLAKIFTKKEAAEKRRLQAYSMGLSRGITSQLDNIIEAMEYDILYYNAKKSLINEQNNEDDDDEGLIV